MVKKMFKNSNDNNRFLSARNKRNSFAQWNNQHLYRETLTSINIPSYENANLFLTTFDHSLAIFSIVRAHRVQISSIVRQSDRETYA